MNVLIVEDDDTFAAAIIDELNKLSLPTRTTHKRSLTTGLESLYADFFDLIVLDLKIPTQDCASDAAVTHGIALFTYAKANAPGTPILVLTGSSADEHIDVIVRHSEKKDVWGEGHKISMVTFLQKYKAGDLPLVFASYANAVKAILDIEIKSDECDLSIAESRIIRIFSKRNKARRCTVTRIGGGLSATKVFRVDASDENGNNIVFSVCKIGLIDDIQDESDRYDQYISRLQPVATPRKVIDLYCGAKNTAGVFYSLAQGYEYTGFDLVLKEKKLIKETLDQLEALFVPWNMNESRKKIGDVRRRLINDAGFTEKKTLIDFAWLDAFENNEIQTRWCCTHGDLHGLNVLIASAGTPVLIDYGDVGEGPASLDPITLELSLLFHPDGPLRNNNWPSIEQSKEWGNLEVYLENCPYPEFVRYCREWSFRVAPGAREVAATAYAYLVRQLKYPNANIVRISSLIEGTKKMFDNTFK